MDPQTEQRHRVVSDFLAMVERAKGPVGKVELHCIHWLPGNTEGVIAARGFTYAGNPEVNPTPRITSEVPDAPPGENLGKARDGALRVGELTRFEGRTPIDGHIHLFNLGTSGSCIKLAPSQECPENGIHTERIFELPSPQFVPGDGAPWKELGPTSDDTGQPERLFAVVTRRDLDVQIKDLHPRLQGRDLYTRRARGPGFAGPVVLDKPMLFGLAPDEWEYGLIALEVRE